MLTDAQIAAIADIRDADGFVQDCLSPEDVAATRTRPAPVVFAYIGAEGFQSVRIGTSGKHLARKVS